MTDYSKMSDQHINQLVGIAISRDNTSIIASDGNAVIHEYADCGEFKGLCLGWKVFDPCNNPTDAWPIILEHGISIISAKGEFICVPSNSIIDGWTGDNAETIYSSSGVIHKNPLRAAMIVFLSM